MKPKEVHPLTEFIPTVADQADLATQIAQDGALREPVVLYEGKIIEGRVRYLAAQDVGIEPTFRDWVLLTDRKDPLDWMVRHHTTSHPELDELARIRLAAKVIDHYRKLPGSTDKNANDAIGLSNRKVRTLDWLQQVDRLDKVLAGEQTLFEAGREIGIVGEQRKIALGKAYGKGDRFDDATAALRRYLAPWSRKGYEFKHINPAEARRRLKVIDQLVGELGKARQDIETRSHSSTFRVPSEKQKKEKAA